MPKTIINASALPYRMRALEAGDVKPVCAYLAEALVGESGIKVHRDELELELNRALDAQTALPRFWIVERKGLPMIIASGPSRDRGGEGFDYVVWMNSSSPPLKAALLRFWLEKWAPSKSCGVLAFCQAHDLLPERAGITTASGSTSLR